MYACGLRASEAIDLESRHVDLRRRRRARARQGVEGAASCRSAATAVRAVADYLRRGRPQLVGARTEPRLFVNFRGGALTRQGLYKIIGRHAQRGPRRTR